MISGTLSKMKVHLGAQGIAEHSLRIGDQEIPLAPYMGKTIRLEFSGDIYCSHCGERTNKSFSQGYCFKHAKTLAACDLCILRPETCHHHLGTCREPEWGVSHCMIPHTVYLANSTGIKVGITRSHQRVTRWLDQGAIQAIPLCEVNTRLDAGKVEVAIKKHIADKTNWRTLLKGDVEEIDIGLRRQELLKEIPESIETAIEPDPEEVRISYLVSKYPEKIVSHNFDKAPVVEGVLWGVKGQYLILDTGVINIRKFAGYDVSVNDLGAQMPASPGEKYVVNLDEIPRVGPYGNW